MGPKQVRLLPVNQKALENRLTKLYTDECNKLYSSIEGKCQEGDPRGITQIIGRRFGYLWEEMMKDVFEYGFENTDRRGLTIRLDEVINEIIMKIIQKRTKLNTEQCQKITKAVKEDLMELLGERELEVSDIVYTKDDKKHAIEAKWRIRWNDAKTVKEHALAAHRLRNMGYFPIMLIRRKRKENFEWNLDRFEREGWIVKTGKKAMRFIEDETHFDLESWIRKNVNFWTVVSDHHDCLREFNWREVNFQF